MHSNGSPRNLGDPVASVLMNREGHPVIKAQDPGTRTSVSWERSEVQARYRQAKATKCGGKDGRESECSIDTEEAGELAPEDPVEEREHQVVERLEGKMPETLSSVSISTKLHSIAERAKKMPGVALTTLAHHIDVDLLREAFRRTRKDAAVGVDERTASEYAANLEDNLRSLVDRAKSGTYRAPPVRRVYIPKGDGSSNPRPIGIPSFEDKVLQRAVTMLLEAVYEPDFLNGSYGFRPKRSPHQALQALREALMSMAGAWVLELDIENCFGSIDRGQLREILRQRVRDGVLLRLIGKWLRAGVLEDGNLRYPQTGTPQGGVISPILCNVFLHEVLDRWFEETVRPRLRGRAFWVRFADDAVLVFALEEDARRVASVLPKRFAKHSLRLHAEKTRLLRFQPPPVTQSAEARSETFNFLGFTHLWSQNKRGTWVVKVRTAKDRLRRAVRATWRWCKARRHDPVRKQHQTLARKVRGHYAYYGIPGNAQGLRRFRNEVGKAWRAWLDRRSHHARMSWERFGRLLKRYPIPPVRMLPFPARSQPAT